MIQFNNIFFSDVPALANKTVVDICKAANINPATYYRMLKGHNVRLSSVLGIANVCEVDPQAFFYDDQQPVLPSSRIYQLFHRPNCRFSFAFSQGTTIQNTDIKWMKAFRSNGFSHNRINRMLNPSPEACTMYPDNVCYICNNYSVSPSVFFQPEQNSEEDAKAQIRARLDILLSEVSALKAQL